MGGTTGRLRRVEMHWRATFLVLEYKALTSAQATSESVGRVPWLVLARTTPPPTRVWGEAEEMDLSSITESGADQRRPEFDVHFDCTSYQTSAKAAPTCRLAPTTATPAQMHLLELYLEKRTQGTKLSS